MVSASSLHRSVLLRIQKETRRLALEHAASPKSKRPDEQNNMEFWGCLDGYKSELYIFLRDLHKKSYIIGEDKEIEKDIELAKSILVELSRMSPVMRPQDWDDIARLSMDITNMRKVIHKVNFHTTVKISHNGPIVSAANVPQEPGLDYLTSFVGLILGVIESRMRRKKA